MLLVEEYEVEPSNVPEMQKVLAEQREVVTDLNLPFLKGWAIYQCKEEPKNFIEVWTLDENANVQELDDAFMAHPKGKTVAPRFLALLVEDSYRNKQYSEVISI